ncbi:hypothetical protein H5410_051716, partial [Solanum commersonii]
PDEKIGEARLRRFLIRGLKKEYSSFVTSIKGWTEQPSVKEFKNFLSNQEPLANQMARSLEPYATLFSREKIENKNASLNEGTMKKNQMVKKLLVTTLMIKSVIDALSKANIASENDGNDKLKWEQCFTIEATEQRNDDVLPVQPFYNNDSFKQEWILDSEDNSTYPVDNEGVLKIDVPDTWAVKLSDVLHALGLKRNLVSVSQITNSGKYILFGLNDVKIMDNVKNISTDVGLMGEKKGSLFVMVVGEAYVKKTSQTDSTTIWDAQLGHLGYQLLRQICSKKLVDGLLALQNIHED